MEEKKLTDEEIARAILQQVEYNAGIPYIDEWLKVKTVKFADILNFIYRLQDKADGYERKIENGGLVSIDWHNEQVGHLEEENAELQKQVDELKEINAKYLESIESVQAGRCRLRCELTEKAVKDTAKEILGLILAKEFEKGDYLTDDELNKLFKERYGVEVE